MLDCRGGCTSTTDIPSTTTEIPSTTTEIDATTISIQNNIEMRGCNETTTENSETTESTTSEWTTTTELPEFSDVKMQPEITLPLLIHPIKEPETIEVILTADGNDGENREGNSSSQVEGFLMHEDTQEEPVIEIIRETYGDDLIQITKDEDDTNIVLIAEPHTFDGELNNDGVSILTAPEKEVILIDEGRDQIAETMDANQLELMAIKEDEIRSHQAVDPSFIRRTSEPEESIVQQMHNNANFDSEDNVERKMNF